MPEASPQREPEINKLFRLAWNHTASDLYLHAGSPPLLRITGVTRKVEIPPLSGEDIERLLAPILSTEHKQLLSEVGVVEFEHMVGREKGVFHLNVLKRDGQLRLSARLSADH